MEDLAVVEDLGRWVGRREAFAAVAGRCSAAEAESLRRIRDDKQFKKLGLSWDQFCSKRLGVSRRQVDRTISLLDEFGPGYFHVAQMTHVTPDEYRAIAPHVGEDGVRVDGAVIALLPENSAQVSAAVTELVRREKPAPSRASPDALAKRCESLAVAIRATAPALDVPDKLKLGTALCHMIQAAASSGVVVLKG